MKKVKIKYKGWLIQSTAEGEYNIYTPDELEQPFGFRQEEATLSTVEQAKTFIDHDND